MRIKLTLQYKGTNFKGWQIQANGLAVQEVLQKTLHRLFQKKITVIAASRTDSGVHAMRQVAHCDLPEGITAVPNRLRYQLNSLLPPDIAVTSVEEVAGSFHAQKSAKRKIYDYQILNSPVPSPFLADYVWQNFKPLDVEKMKKAAKVLVGEHDFSSFAASDRSTKTSVRKIYRVVIASDRRERSNPVAPSGLLRYARDDADGRMITITLEGNGFLKQMVRNIVGTLVDVGRGRTSVAQFRRILASKDRRAAGRCAPARGLILREVIY